MIILESIILAAGFCSRFDFKDSALKKYMLPFERSNILNYIIIAMHRAGIEKVNIIIDDKIDKSKIHNTFYDFIDKLEIDDSPKLNFVENKYSERENGFSLYLGLKKVTSQNFVLSMADHIFSQNLYSILIENYKNQDIILATDPMKVKGIYDLDDCTKIFGNNSQIIKIGKKIPEYNRLDMGVFIMKSNPIRKISEKIEKEKNKFGVSDVVLSAISSNLNVTYYDFSDTIWLDIDTEIEYKKLDKVFYQSSEFRPFNLEF